MDVYPSTCTLENNDSRNEFVSFFPFFLFNETPHEFV